MPLSSVITRAAIAPVSAQPTLKAEQVTQLVLGETAAVLESAGEWRRIATDYDGYEGWVHAGYLLDVIDEAAEQWRRQADGWSLGAIARLHGLEVCMPLRARVALAGDRCVRLPDGTEAPFVSGKIDAFRRVVAEAKTMPAERWALAHFAGTPYAWGGVTPWGVDCSGLVQTTFAARGIVLPRDASQQIECGVPVPLGAPAPGDLLFFRSETGANITHVAFAGADDTLIHSTVARGGVVREPIHGERVAALMPRLVAIRRIERHG